MGADARGRGKCSRIVAVALAIFPLLAACSGNAAGSGPASSHPSAADIVPGEVIVKFRIGTTERRIDMVLEESGTRIARALGAPGTYLLRFDDRTPVARMIEVLRRYPEIEHAEPNRIIRLNPPPVLTPKPPPLK